MSLQEAPKDIQQLLEHSPCSCGTQARCDRNRENAKKIVSSNFFSGLAGHRAYAWKVLADFSVAPPATEATMFCFARRVRRHAVKSVEGAKTVWPTLTVVVATYGYASLTSLKTLPRALKILQEFRAEDCICAQQNL